MTSLSYTAMLEVHPELREKHGREMREMREGAKPATWAERFENFWASLYATPMPAPRHYL